MSSSVIVGQPQSLFPVLPAVEAHEYFDSIINGARREYDAKYNQYSPKPDEITGKTKAWNEFHAKMISGTEQRPEEEAFNTDFWLKVDTYIGYRKVREDCKRIVDLYNRAITDCTPMVFDASMLAMLKTFQRLKIRVPDIASTFDKTFGVDLDQLKDQRTKIQELFTKISSGLEDMRRAGEKYAKMRKDAQSYWTGYTPYFSKAVDIREAELALARPPAQQLPAQPPRAPEENKQ